MSRLVAQLKKPVIKIIHFPSKVHAALFQAASHGKLPCPDKLFLKWHFRVMVGKKLDFKNPVTYQEKLQWLKYYYHDPLYTQLVDKYGAREYIARTIGEEYLVPLYGVYNSFDDIPFDELPDRFVLKCTHDSGSVVICRDKATFDKEEARKILEEGLARKQFYLSREWPYKNVPPRIICEKYLEDELIEDAPDYKFFCFDGKVKALLVNSERHSPTGVKTNYYTPDWERIPMREHKFPNNPKPDSRPAKLEEMIRLAETLSAGMPHVRVDFNYVNQHIYFGEMTFYHGGGRLMFIPDEYNYVFGDWLTLPEKRR
ncbi:MAG: ATP-grasp fold amidoligase family protein [Acutalibacteraceae bacterium]